jgi:MoaA/NifB/PqqE/SkfB family radical SAM enzyme
MDPADQDHAKYDVVYEGVASGGKVNDYMVDLYVKLSYPATGLVMTLLGIGLSASKRKTGLATGFGLTLVIAFTYSEPVAFLEYAKDVAKAAKKAGLKVVVATAAFVEPKPILDLAKYVDAFAIALKGFDEDFYYHVCGVHFEPILEAIKAVKKHTKCWLELVNLVVPTYNDNAETIAKMVRWIRQNVGGNVPVHFARFVPIYQLTNLPRTPVQTLEAACAAAKKNRTINDTNRDTFVNVAIATPLRQDFVVW